MDERRSIFRTAKLRSPPDRRIFRSAAASTTSGDTAKLLKVAVDWKELATYGLAAL
ncbi:MAG TPA: hypothetical protein VI160_00620 [Gemmatimonadales bacterium]